MSTPPEDPATGQTPGNPGGEAHEGLSRIGLVSEEGDTEGGASPQKDFAAAVVIGAVALIAAVMGLTMENPGRKFLTSPGLLPFLAGLSLFAMSIGLGANALRRGGVQDLFDDFGGLFQRYFQDQENRSALLLIGIVLLYVVLIDFISFDPRIPLGIEGFEVRFSSFEAVTIVILTYVLRIFWKKPLLQCLLVSFLTSTSLSLSFRLGFQLIMPGVN